MADRSADLTLDVVGAGPAYTGRPGATGAAYLVRHGDGAILLDLGQGSFPRLAGLVEPSALLAIVVSHLHPDHFVDLVPLRHYLRYERHPSARMRVLGPAGLGDRLDGLHAEPGFAATALDIEPLSTGGRRIGPFELEAALVTHTAESYAFRLSIDGGAGLVYSGDCGRADDLRSLIRRGDTLLTEVSFGPGPVSPGAFHLDGPGVGRLASSTGIERVLQNHLQMGFDREATVAAVRARFAGSVDLVDPGFRTVV